jgi:hypothetical protein
MKNPHLHLNPYAWRHAGDQMFSTTNGDLCGWKLLHVISKNHVTWKLNWFCFLWFETGDLFDRLGELQKSQKPWGNYDRMFAQKCMPCKCRRPTNSCPEECTKHEGKFKFCLFKNEILGDYCIYEDCYEVTAMYIAQKYINFAAKLSIL